MIAATAVRPTRPKVPLDARPAYRAMIAVGSVALTLLSAVALVRLFAGIAPSMPHLKTPALIIHLATAIPAVPLGGYLMLSRKGDARHRLLGKIWLAMMSVTAIAALFIRNVNNGQFSWIHLFVVLTIVSVPRAYFAARRGDTDKHRAIIRGFFLGAGLLAGFASFMPHRTMWWMAFG